MDCLAPLRRGFFVVDAVAVLRRTRDRFFRGEGPGPGTPESRGQRARPGRGPSQVNAMGRVRPAPAGRQWNYKIEVNPSAARADKMKGRRQFDVALRTFGMGFPRRATWLFG
jgi:hypothetical protein